MRKNVLGCNYHGQFFGASYPDACCIDGYLWDEDSCDEPGGPLHHGGEDPCPNCNEDEAVSIVAAALRAQHRYSRLKAARLAMKQVRQHVADMQTKWGFFYVAPSPQPVAPPDRREPT